MKTDLFRDDDSEPKFTVLETRYVTHGNRKIVTYIHTIGNNYRPVAHSCNTAPWEDCACAKEGS